MTPPQLLADLLATPSPSGYEVPVQTLVRSFLEPHAETLTTDVHGNVIAARNPNGSPRLMLAAHCDQIGMVISHVDEQGFLYAQTIGGWDPQQLIGQRMTVWADQGPVPAVIARKPIHLLTDTERRQVVKLEELWLDIGAKDQEEALGRVRIGDPVTLALGAQWLDNRLVTAPGLDDKAGVWVVLEAFRRADRQHLKAGLFTVSTVQEEVGLRGAITSTYGVAPDVGIAVDVTHATDCPTIDRRQRGDIKLGGGPVIFRGPNLNPEVVARLIALAEENDIPYQVAAIGRACPNDSNSIQISRAGVATGLLAIPNRYMHSAVEMVSLDDLDAAAELLAKFALDLQPDSSFIPGSHSNNGPSETSRAS